eukprot:Skav204292  [mRNA]  locus=scaffold409:431756:434258:+ [translate_table: standard]
MDVPQERAVSKRSISRGGKELKKLCSRTFFAIGLRRGFSMRISERTATARLELRGSTDWRPLPGDVARKRQASARRANSGQSAMGCPRTAKIL